MIYFLPHPLCTFQPTFHFVARSLKTPGKQGRAQAIFCQLIVKPLVARRIIYLLIEFYEFSLALRVFRPHRTPRLGARLG